MNLRSTSHRDGDKVNCPYCESIQVKSMANQPRKYPNPVPHGYDCKKCGNDFVSIPWTATPQWQEEVVTPPKPQKSAGFFTKLLGYLLLAVIAFIVYAAIFSSNKSEPTTVESTPDSIEKIIKEVEDSDLKYNEDDPTPVAIEATPVEEFSGEAEEAAHGDMPYLDSNDKKDSIADSRNQDDTLSIKTTIRESE